MISALAWPLFAIGAYQDYQRREAANWLWAIAVALGVLEAGRTGQWVAPTLGVTSMTALAGAAYHAEWLGGADVKAIVAAGALYPAQLPTIAIVTGGAGAVVAATTDGEHIPFLIPLFAGVTAAVARILV